MKKFFTLVLGMAVSLFTMAQTTEYTTGQTYSDPWTGWSTPIVTNISGSSVNGADVYTFAGSMGNAYTIETYKQISINSNDLDFYFAATTQNATFSIEFSTDNVSYTQIGTQTVGAGFALSTLVVPTFDPVVSTFYIKLKMSGTFGSPSSAFYNNLRIDAVLNSGNSVSVAPTTVQNILEGVNGTTLTATEAPSAATGREWKYSTTSGSGYVSFGTAQTGTTYTPNFASAGTYYVICESNFSGDVQTSNEVQINVSAPSGIEEFDFGSTVLYSNGTLFVKTNKENYQVQIYSLDGKTIGTYKNMKSFDFSDENEGVYFVAITYKGERKTIKIAHIK